MPRFVPEDYSLCNKLGFSNSYVFATKCRNPQIFQTMNSDGSNNLCLKYQRFATSGSNDKWMRNNEFAAKTQFL